MTQKKDETVFVNYSRSNMRSAKSITIFSNGEVKITLDGRSESKAWSGSISPEERDHLLSLLGSKEFSGLKSSYINPKIDDGFSIHFSYKEKHITIENEKIPGTLLSIFEYIDLLSNKISQ